MKSIKSVSVCGLGKLGACMAATFAARGYPVVGVDIDPEKIRSVSKGERLHFIHRLVPLCEQSDIQRECDAPKEKFPARCPERGFRR